MPPAAPITDHSGRPVDVTHGVYFMPDALSLAIALGLTLFAAFVLSLLLVRFRVPVRTANAFSGAFLGITAFAVYFLMKALSNP